MQRLHLLLNILVVTTAACTDGRSDVVITGVHHHLTPDGRVARPADLSTMRIQVHADGELHPALPIVGDASGVFTIPGVPDGPIVIAAESISGQRFWWASEDHDVEWSWRFVGRLDGRRAETQQPMLVDADGLAPWSITDSLIAYSLETGTELSPALAPSLRTGATAIDATFDWNASDAWSSNRTGRPYLMEEGDTFALARSSRSIDSESRVIYRLTQLLAGTAARQESGVVTPITGTFTTVEPTSQIRFSVDHALFGRTLPVAPSNVDWEVALYHTPAWMGSLGVGTPLISVEGARDFDGAVETQLESYGDPFDPSWERWVRARYFADADHYSDSMTRLEGNQYVISPPAPFAKSALLDGQPLGDQPVTWDGSSPLELEVPGADGFQATLSRVRQNPANPDWPSYESVGMVRSDTHRAVLPADVFEPGETYQLAVRLGAQTDDGYGYSTSVIRAFRFASR